jgi:hypothetical protein
MSDERTTASVKRDHITLMNRLFRWDATANKWVAQPEVFFSIPNIAVDMGNFVGALNKYDREQYPAPGDLPPPPTDPISAYRARLAGGQWRAYASVFFTEANELKTAFPNRAQDIDLILALYGPGGGGNISGETDGTNYWFYKWINGQAVKTPDVNGAADAYVYSLAGPSYRTLYL